MLVGNLRQNLGVIFKKALLPIHEESDFVGKIERKGTLT